MGRLVVVIYVLLIIAFAIYGNWWGDYAYKGFAYNFGRALIWPIIMFPGRGKVIGGILLLFVVGGLLLKRN